MRCKNHDGSIAIKFLGNQINVDKFKCKVRGGLTTKQPKARSWVKHGICTTCAIMIFPDQYPNHHHSKSGKKVQNNSLNALPLLTI